jgi:pimeloyl-ACP methyl ester carboxylesterase
MQPYLRILFTIVFTASALAARADAIRWEPYVLVADDGSKVETERGELRVPENRANAESATITLRFVRFRATTRTPGSPIVYLAGGPGGSGIQAARGARLPLFLALREFGDVIALDQRGVGQSEPSLACDGSYAVDPAVQLSEESVAAGIVRALEPCAAGLRAKGVDLAAYNTIESAHDLEDLRVALGAKKLTLWGISYGTHLSLAMLKAHPGSVDRMILAGVEPLDSTLKLPGDQQELLGRIAALAAKQQVHRDLLGGIAQVLRELRKTPQTVKLVHPLTRAEVALTLGPLDLQFVVADMLNGPDTFRGLPDFITRLERGDWVALALASGRLRFGRAPSMMSVAMDCASGVSEARRKRIREEAKNSLLGDAINLPFPAICKPFAIPDLGDAFRADVRSEVPALLISGTLDGRTRPRAAKAISRGLRNATHLVIEGAGHSDPLFLSSGKILVAMKQFLGGGRVDVHDVTAEIPPFLPPRTVVPLTDEKLDRLAGEYRVNDQSIRRIVRMGSLLYSIRDKGQPYPLRPISANEFFMEGLPIVVRFKSDDSGRITGLQFVTEEGVTESPKVQ